MYSLQKVIARFGFVVIIVLPEECATPDHETGRCVQLFSCPSLLPLFSSPPKDRLSYVKNFRCGSRYSPPQVCCPPVYRFDSKPHSVPLSDRRYCGRQHSDDYLHSDRKNKTKIDEFPWVVAVMTMLGGGKNPPRELIYCHGVLIDRRYALTSVKCIEDTDTHLKSWVRLGDYTTNTKVDCVDVHVDTDCNKPEDVGIEAILKHPLYNEGNYVFLKINDIGLLRLNKTLDYTEYIRPICLPESGINFPKNGDVVYSAGWTLPNHVRYDPYIKRKSTVTLID
ncbi:hypothetical protein FQR65_LT02475 [Abscondita terminalis]|nr:hypothetical protein FQR65_LT02475 [Abscondita terminalis]